ncbi:MAG: carboxylating nicotinate-nucleotide diphosphorylase [Thermoanaerobaculia bacterium]
MSRRLAPPPAWTWEPALRAALEEDLGRAGDLTSEAVVPAEAVARGSLLARRDGRIAGLEMARAAFAALDAAVGFAPRTTDGVDVAGGQPLARVEGNARALLAAERTALNFLGHLSGIASATCELVQRLGDHPARVVCTRKTTPGLRALEKYAVRAGGGSNHRFGLDDAVLIKDNHLAVAGGVAEAVRRARRRVGHLVKVEVEVESLAQLDAALASGADVVMLDNMALPMLAEAVTRARGRAVTEASGGVTAETIQEIAATGVDLISVGWLTHSAPCLDVAFDLERDG